MKHWIILLSLLTFQAVASADELEVSISDKSIDGAYEIMYGNNFSSQFSVVHTVMDDVDNADVEDPATYISEQDNVQTNIAGYGLFANSKVGNLKTHLGGKAFYLDTEHGNDMYGIALGGALDAYVRRDIFFTGQILYAPDIITGGDFDDYWEFNTRASFQVMNNANVYVGYRLMAANFEKVTNDSNEVRDFFNGLYVGFRFNL